MVYFLHCVGKSNTVYGKLKTNCTKVFIVQHFAYIQPFASFVSRVCVFEIYRPHHLIKTLLVLAKSTDTRPISKKRWVPVGDQLNKKCLKSLKNEGLLFGSCHGLLDGYRNRVSVALTLPYMHQSNLNK